MRGVKAIRPHASYLSSKYIFNPFFLLLKKKKKGSINSKNKAPLIKESNKDFWDFVCSYRCIAILVINAPLMCRIYHIFFLCLIINSSSYYINKKNSNNLTTRWIIDWCYSNAINTSSLSSNMFVGKHDESTNMK